METVRPWGRYLPRCLAHTRNNRENGKRLLNIHWPWPTMIMKQVQASVREEIRPEKIPSSGHLASATQKGL